MTTTHAAILREFIGMELDHRRNASPTREWHHRTDELRSMIVDTVPLALDEKDRELADMTARFNHAATIAIEQTKMIYDLRADEAANRELTALRSFEAELIRARGLDKNVAALRADVELLLAVARAALVPGDDAGSMVTLLQMQNHPRVQELLREVQG